MTKLPNLKAIPYKIIAVGLDDGGRAAGLISKLHACGFPVMEISDVADLSDALRDGCRSAILVYSPAGAQTAEKVLCSVANLMRSTPVLVIVDEADFGQYYGLMMHDGAADYLSLSESPEMIVNAIHRTLSTLAA